MRKLSVFFILGFIAVIFFAFNSGNSIVENNSIVQNNVDNDPAFQKAKKDFWAAYQLYKDNISKGIASEPPVDPTGRFKIDENGNFNLIGAGNTQSDNIHNGNHSDNAIATYLFSQSNSTYTSINGTGTFVTSNCDDNSYGGFNIGFTFVYDGTSYTQFGLNCNGWVSMGPAPAPFCAYTPVLNQACMTDCIVPFNNDLYGLASGNGIYYQTTGSAPNRVCTIEFYHWGYYSSGTNEMDFELKLYETSNNVQFVYKPETPASIRSDQVGIRGVPITDFLSRTTTTDWTATTAGTNASTLAFSSTIFPPLGLTFTYSPSPAVPTLTAPANHSIGLPLVDTFTWSASSGATGYRYQLGTDSLFTVIVINQIFGGTGVIVSGFPPLSTWWWRVAAIGPGGQSNFQVPFTFKTKGAPLVPTTLVPSNNAVNQPLSLTCRWSKAFDQTLHRPGAISFRPLESTEQTSNKGINDPQRDIGSASNYWYELYADTTTAPLVRDSTLTDTSRAVSGLGNLTNYWWRVKAKNDVGWGAFSPYSKFTTIIAAPSGQPTLIFPANNSSGINLTTYLIWGSVATATSYEVQVSLVPSFSSTQLDSVTTHDSVQVPAGILANNVTYYWRVRGVNIGGSGPFSTIFIFTTNLTGISQYSNGVPKLFALHNNYPNPFNPSSTIKFDIPKASAVKLVIYNVLGQEELTLVNSNLEAGFYSIRWDASNYPSGVYFYRITAGNFTDIKKMVLVK